MIYFFSYLLIIYVVTHISHTGAANPLVNGIFKECQLREYESGNKVCVCNSTFCDTVYVHEKVSAPNYVRYTSDKEGKRFRLNLGQFVPVDIDLEKKLIFVNPVLKYQDVFGFGGAITDSAGMNIHNLSKAAQENLMRSYFGEYGIGYTFIRVTIGASDFSLRGYSYDESNLADPSLNNFKLTAEDLDYKIPLIQQAISLTNNTIKIIASAWTSPKWMKTIPDYSVPFAELKEEMYQPWAEYHKKFLDAYKENNITIWGLTTGNEPVVGLIILPSTTPNIAFTPNQLKNWVVNNLGPTIRNSEYSDIKIIAVDDKTTFLTKYTDIIFQHPNATSYIDGIGIHWNNEKNVALTVLQNTHSQYPDKFLLGTEICRGNGFFETPVTLGSWQRGEDYARGIIQNMNNWVVGWIDWNIALNEKGGPSYAKKVADSPIIVNQTSDEFYKQPMFYVMGHFSKFVPPGSVRVDITQYEMEVLTIAFQRPDESIVVILVNTLNKPVDVSMVDKKRKQQANILLTPYSISTILYWCVHSIMCRLLNYKLANQHNQPRWI